MTLAHRGVLVLDKPFQLNLIFYLEVGASKSENINVRLGCNYFQGQTLQLIRPKHQRRGKKVFTTLHSGKFQALLGQSDLQELFKKRPKVIKLLLIFEVKFCWKFRNLRSIMEQHALRNENNCWTANISF
jgi:hypothetical protein